MEVLIHNRNTSDNWGNVLVSDKFDEMLKLYEYNNLSSVDSIELPILSGGEQ